MRVKTKSCAKAIILCTADDMIKKENETYYQARPNVFLELGYFISEIGCNNIILVNEPDSKIPTDYQGICYITFKREDGIDKLFEKIKVELKK